MKKSILVVLSLSLSASVLGEELKNEPNNIFEQCEKNTLNTLLDYTKKKKEFVSGNPFSDNCVSFSINKVEQPKYNKDNFELNQLYENYKKLIELKENMVVNLVDSKNNKVYQFFRMSEEDFFMQSMKKSWGSYNDLMEKYFDDFIKLHELYHLDFENQKDLRRKEQESLSDISSIVFLSLEKKLTVRETVDFLNTVKNLRNRDKIKGYEHPISGKVYDDEHLEKSMFNKIIDLLEDYDLELPLNKTDLFKNTTPEKLSKKIRDITKR